MKKTIRAQILAVLAAAMVLTLAVCLLLNHFFLKSFYDRKKGPAIALSVIGFVILCICAGVYMMTVMRKEDEK